MTAWDGLVLTFTHVSDVPEEQSQLNTTKNHRPRCTVCVWLKGSPGLCSKQCSVRPCPARERHLPWVHAGYPMVRDADRKPDFLPLQGGAGSRQRSDAPFWGLPGSTCRCAVQSECKPARRVDMSCRQHGGAGAAPWPMSFLLFRFLTPSRRGTATLQPVAYGCSSAISLLIRSNNKIVLACRPRQAGLPPVSLPARKQFVAQAA